MMPETRRPRRFYKTVGVEADGDAWIVTLDGRPLKTPAKKPFAAPTRALAELAAEEWAAQGVVLDVDAMFATRLLNVAFDRVPVTREEVAGEIARVLETDLTCHLADEEPRLLERQEAVWRPLRDWAGAALGVKLVPAPGIVAREQPPESLEAGRRAALAENDVGLAALAHATAMLGSAVIAFAMRKQRIDAVEAFDAARVDEMFQEEQWGVDEAASIRALHMAKELGVTERVMRAL